MTAFGMKNSPRSASYFTGCPTSSETTAPSAAAGESAIPRRREPHDPRLHDPRGLFDRHVSQVPLQRPEGVHSRGCRLRLRAHTPGQIMAVFDTIPDGHLRKGVSRVIKPQGEPRRPHRPPAGHAPTTRPAEAGPGRALAGCTRRRLTVYPGVGGLLGAKKRADGLHLLANDLDWSHGEGPEVCGRGEAILPALTGRPVVLDELTGDGLALLRDRIAA